MTIIGNEGGFLPEAFVIPGGEPLLLAPAERADVLHDFSGVPAGTYRVTNDAPAPYPTGVGENPVPEWMVRGGDGGERFEDTHTRAGGVHVCLRPRPTHTTRTRSPAGHCRRAAHVAAVARQHGDRCAAAAGHGADGAAAAAV